jgi:hypothetical protein
VSLGIEERGLACGDRDVPREEDVHAQPGFARFEEGLAVGEAPHAPEAADPIRASSASVSAGNAWSNRPCSSARAAASTASLSAGRVDR